MWSCCSSRWVVDLNGSCACDTKVLLRGILVMLCGLVGDVALKSVHQLGLDAGLVIMRLTYSRLI